jgi:hypothetical protein
MKIVAFSEKLTAQSLQVGGRSTPPLQLDIPNGALNYNFQTILRNRMKEPARMCHFEPALFLRRFFANLVEKVLFRRWDYDKI